MCVGGNESLFTDAGSTEVWMTQLLFSGKPGQAGSGCHWPAMCLCYSTQHLSLGWGERFSLPLHACQSIALVFLGELGSWFPPIPYFLFISREGVVFPGEGDDALSFLRLAVHRMETFFIFYFCTGFAFLREEELDPSPGSGGRCLSSCSPELIDWRQAANPCSAGPGLPRCRSRLCLSCAVLRSFGCMSSLRAPTQPPINLLYSSLSDCKYDYFSVGSAPEKFYYPEELEGTLKVRLFKPLLCR